MIMRVASLSDEFERAASGEERSVAWASPVQDNDFRKLAQAPVKRQDARAGLTAGLFAGLVSCRSAGATV
jgi:hypothetical protein